MTEIASRTTAKPPSIVLGICQKEELLFAVILRLGFHWKIWLTWVIISASFESLNSTPLLNLYMLYLSSIYLLIGKEIDQGNCNQDEQ